MPKHKSRKSILKRVRISKTGMIRHRTAGHKHLRSGKGGKRLRQMRSDPFMSNPEAKRLEKILFRRLRGRAQDRATLRRSPTPAERRAAVEAKAAAKAAKASKSTPKAAVAAKAPAKAPAKKS
jgi:large subunit ribosomal protein L35